MMDHGACNIIYLDRRAREELVRRDSLLANRAGDASGHVNPSDYFSAADEQLPVEVRSNLESLLSIFNEVHVCRSGGSCLSKLSDLQKIEVKDSVPTIVLIDIPYDEEQHLKRKLREQRTPSPTSTRSRHTTHDYLEVDGSDGSNVYGMSLLTHITAEIQARTMSKLVIPVVVLSGFEREWASSNLPSPSVHGSQVLSDTVRLTRYLDAGAADVLTSPLSKDHAQGLAVHAYRTYKEVGASEAAFLAQKRNRKRSWVGVDDTKPYAYLREAMVSNLMGHICNPETVGESHDPSEIVIAEGRHEVIAEAIGTWAFSAHAFSDDELLHASLLMLEHALLMPEVEKWRIPTADLKTFLLASRHAYNEFVLYHNFRHVVDVLQASFYFLLQLGILPDYPPSDRPHTAGPKSAIASLLKPFDALTLLISAIGHDVGHPGVNNAFLVALNAPLAQLYNDRSVLESFHCAAYSQILRRFWPASFDDAGMRKLMINSILATDMGLHFKYMQDLGNLQEKLEHNKNSLDGWNLKIQEEYRDLACGLLIKCADISNVARKFDVASQWATILTDEFSNQGIMELELNIPTQLFGGPPVRDNIVKMGESQIGFMNIFARPLFESVTAILPPMQFSVDEILINKAVWQRKMDEAKEGKHQEQVDGAEDSLFPPQTRGTVDGMMSPMSGSRVTLSETNAAASRDSTEETEKVRSSSEGIPTTLMHTSPSLTGCPNDRKKKKKDRFSSRLRSKSPARPKPKPRDRSSSKHDPSRPHTSPQNNDYDYADTTNGVPQLPHKLSQPDIRHPHMNGHAVPPVPPMGSVGSDDTANKVYSSGTDLPLATPGKNRMSRFGFGKLFKKRFRTPSASQTSNPSSRTMVDDHSEAT
ncbi:HD-domain/PDEase-like protein [Venturia nashicola]|uniref:Phosphodiesterase n=1 Tax=Venturia nashicola TaxID=86259 RepID=A0A4Z1P8H1_9PEZI|nr:HD-domain/PDEase-like protein [Venturia nashicola]TLD32484.1 HD-domain/PDEase-like protein [Venturia nashicola]